MRNSSDSGGSSSKVSDRLQVFHRILQDHEIPLRRFTASYASEPADRDDLFQEIALAIWTAWPRFRGDCSERTWVYRIAHNVAISASVRRRRRAQTTAPFPQDITAHKSLEPESQSVERERRQLLIEAVRSIRGLDKQIVVLYLEGLSNREIAEVVGLSEGATATRLSRVRVTLAEFVRAKGGET